MPIIPLTSKYHIVHTSKYHNLKWFLPDDISADAHSPGRAWSLQTTGDLRERRPSIDPVSRIYLISFLHYRNE